ncbi:conserved protein of unknown function [Methylocella tundrae]|uniref:DUF4167 domain-containing protein n=2 Tax=Methylocella tundrae TaxID=227605 RepID=A0A4U8Z5A3_METTU|nr:DUF4167 domain-containing protein [Methylocella tundrae]VFU10694.1 conserved protein of unknown function [Methylocella tundrae]
MRPGQNNKRMRGRPNSNRKGPNPLTRSYESSGPDVKIRGTAHHIGEKYLQLARDAQSSGDPVTAESYLQHAEHYFRLIAVAQQAQQQSAAGYQRQPGDAIADETDDGDDFTGIPDRFASPPERFAAPQPAFAPQPQSGNPQQPQDRGFYGNGGGSAEKQGFERPERGPRQERAPYQERSYQDRPYSERSSQERGGQDRGGQERYGSDRGGPSREQGSREPASGQAPGRDAPGREQESRASRGGRSQRDFRGEAPREQRGDRAPVDDGEPKGLPAFITAPVRAVSDALSEPLEANASVETLNPIGDGHSDAEREPNGFHLRPRRRRRSKAEMAIDSASADDSNHAESSAKDPVGD